MPALELAVPAQELRTLQLGPLWVLSALVGTHTNFSRLDLDAFVTEEIGIDSV